MPQPKRAGTAKDPTACIVESEPVDATGGVAVVAFPGRGLAATLAAAYLAETLHLRPIGRLDCDAIPSVAIVEDGQVVHPVRLLFGLDGRSNAKAHPVALFLSEVPLDEENAAVVAQCILAWCKAKGIATLLSTESVGLEESEEAPEVIRLWGVGNRPELNRRLAKARLPLAKEGIVAGVTGALLDKGLEADLDLVALVAIGQGPEPDVRTATRLVEFLAKFLGWPVKVDRLRREAERFEKHLRDIERRRLQTAGGTDPQEFV